MARKVFISFLGTSNYLETHYEFQGKTTKPVRFIQEALIENICADWTNDDKILIFCTEKSKSLNWADNGQRTEIDIEKVGLQTRLSLLNLPDGMVECVDIVEGFSEKEIWDIFSTVYSKLQVGDEIYFDVTHAFRSIPMFSVILFNYSQFLKNTELKAVHYGAFEKLGPSFELKSKPLEERGVAPIIDLTPMVKLQHLTEVSASFVKYGHVKQISKLLSDVSDDDIVKQVVKAISSLDDSILCCRLNDLIDSKSIIPLLNSYKAVNKSSSIPKALKELVLALVNRVKYYGFVAEKSYENVRAAVQWSIDYDMVIQSYALLQEYIVLRVESMFADLNPYDMSDKKNKKAYKEFIGAILGVPQEDVENGNLKRELDKHRTVANELLNNTFIKALRSEYLDFTSYRNGLVHAKGTIDFDGAMSKIREVFPKFVNLISTYANQPL